MRSLWNKIRLREQKSQIAVKDVSPLRLEDYVRAVGGFPRPTTQQIRSFANYVTEAHSWYKHLPLLPPGQRFHFYLDPARGYKRLICKGRIVLVDLVEDSQRFHYNERKTAEYREQFGHLAFEPWSMGATYVTPRRLKRLVVIPLREISVDGLPPDILEAGRVELTGVIHPLAAQPDIIFRRGLRHRSEDRGDDPQSLTLHKALVALARENDLDSGKSWEPHPAIEALLRPERERQLDAMVMAMQRVCEIVYEST